MTTLKSIFLDLPDLVNENNDSDEDKTKTLVEMCRVNKKRRRRLLKSVKQLSREQEIDARENEKRCKKATYLGNTAKQDVTDQKKIANSAFNGIETLHMFREGL